MWVAAVASDRVTADAVRRRSLIVTGRTSQQITPCRTSVEVDGRGIASDPFGRMRVARVQRVAADPALHVAGVATGNGVAGQAARWLGTSGHGMPRKKIWRMDGVAIPLQQLGVFLRKRQWCRRVVAIVTLFFRMTLRASRLEHPRLLTVLTHEGAIVADERLGLESREICLGVAVQTGGLFELLLVIVALQTGGHRRKAGGRPRQVRLHLVTGHALPLDFFHPDVELVGEPNRSRSGTARRRRGLQRRQLLGLALAMTLSAGTQLRQHELFSSAIMTALAGQTFGLIRLTAIQLGQMQLMREASASVRGMASGRQRRAGQDNHQQPRP